MTKIDLLKYNLDKKFSYDAPHKIYPTISENVAFCKLDKQWRFIALDNDLTDHVVIGPYYSTRKALCADMARYISESGY